MSTNHGGTSAPIENGPGNENPSEKGPEEESAGEGEVVPTKRSREVKPVPGPGAPLVPDHQNIDSNPIDPRVF
jgi:hypothetical protein